MLYADAAESVIQDFVASNPQIITPTNPLYASVSAGPPVVTGPIVAQVGETASVYSSSVVIQSIALTIDKPPSPMPVTIPAHTFCMISSSGVANCGRCDLYRHADGQRWILSQASCTNNDFVWCQATCYD